MRDDWAANERDMKELTVIERKLRMISRLSAFVLLCMVGIFGGYVSAGITVTYFLPGTLPYPFLSLDSDPVFIVFGTVLGTLTCLSGACVTVYALISPLTTDRTGKAIIVGMTTIGFGLAILRFTLRPLITYLSNYFSKHIANISIYVLPLFSV